MSAEKPTQPRSVSFCHQCNKQLVRGRGGFIFVEIEDPVGNVVYTHKTCADDLVGDGYKRLGLVQGPLKLGAA